MFFLNPVDTFTLDAEPIGHLLVRYPMGFSMLFQVDAPNDGFSFCDHRGHNTSLPPQGLMTNLVTKHGCQQ